MRIECYLGSSCRVLSAGLALLLSVGVHCVKGQSEVNDQVSQAIRLIHLQPQAAREQLTRLGARGFPKILEVMHNDSRLGPIEKAFLVAVIGRSKGKDSFAALTVLLSDDDPYVRGLAASYFGERRHKPAMANLVGLLEDKGVYLTRTRTHPASEEPIFVRDKAIEALEAITRKKLEPEAAGDERAKAWQQWWLRHRRARGQMRTRD